MRKKGWLDEHLQKYGGWYIGVLLAVGDLLIEDLIINETVKFLTTAILCIALSFLYEFWITNTLKHFQTNKRKKNDSSCYKNLITFLGVDDEKQKH